MICCVGASGDQLKQKLDSISDTVSDNVRDRGTLSLVALSSSLSVTVLSTCSMYLYDWVIVGEVREMLRYFITGSVVLVTVCHRAVYLFYVPV